MAVQAAVNAQVQPQQDPVQALRNQQENSFGRQVNTLRLQCINKHKENGSLIGSVLGVISIAAGIFTSIMVGGVGGILFGFATWLVLGKCFAEIYHGMRNRDYLEAEKALQASNFREYINNHGLDLSIDTIVSVHKSYKQYLQTQIQQLEQQV